MSLSLSGGMGVILGVFIGQYVGAGHSVSDITLLITLPSLFIGLGGCSAALRRTEDDLLTEFRQFFRPTTLSCLWTTTGVPLFVLHATSYYHRFSSAKYVRGTPCHARSTGIRYRCS